MNIYKVVEGEITCSTVHTISARRGVSHIWKLLHIQHRISCAANNTHRSFIQFVLRNEEGSIKPPKKVVTVTSTISRHDSVTRLCASVHTRLHQFVWITNCWMKKCSASKVIIMIRSNVACTLIYPFLCNHTFLPCT